MHARLCYLSLFQRETDDTELQNTSFNTPFPSLSSHVLQKRPHHACHPSSATLVFLTLSILPSFFSSHYPSSPSPALTLPIGVLSNQ